MELQQTYHSCGKYADKVTLFILLFNHQMSVATSICNLSLTTFISKTLIPKVGIEITFLKSGMSICI